MPTCLHRVARVAACLTLAAAPLHAQQRRNLIEVGLGATYQSFDNATNLQAAFGGVGRAGLWLPFHFELEGEAMLTRPRTTFNGFGWKANTLSGSLLYNILVGKSSSAFIRAGYGSTTYDADRCAAGSSFFDIGPCGSTPVMIGGVGFRAGIRPTAMLRVDLAANRSTAKSLTTFGASIGLAVMLGSKPSTDRDGDGVYDTEDRCANTPAGVLVDRRGCPTDSDRDGVADGLDRCPATVTGTQVDATGCPRDTDRDGVPDGIDRCANTPPGASVDPAGCPIDSDKDGIADGLDRCPDTPQGATVDQLGCPGDEDGDGVFDGLDRCPRTPPGQTVNAFGCPPSARLPEGNNPPGAPAPRGGPGSGTAGTGGTVLRGVAFLPGSARLTPESSPVLDSLARVLLATPSLSIEIGGHTDITGDPSANLHLSRLRAEAVRNYLITQKVPFTRLVAKGYGSSAPLTRDPTQASQALNRRVEIKPLAAPTGR
ncbi:MAG: OmpA family protein [Gemmatimonadales bacterium]|nr:OmpA family protein [Gemmatimonadales bacterium]